MPSVPAGRPRDPAIDARVLAATRRMLADAGWEGTSIRGVAELAGVSRPAIARRWPSKAHLVLEALVGAEPDMVAFAGVDVEGWVDGIVDGAFALFDRPEMRSAVPGLLGAARDHEDLRIAVWERFTVPAAELATELARDDRRLVAQAAIAAAAGAALFSTAMGAGEQVRDELRRLLRAALLAAVSPGG